MWRLGLYLVVIIGDCSFCFWWNKRTQRPSGSLPQCPFPKYNSRLCSCSQTMTHWWLESWASMCPLCWVPPALSFVLYPLYPTPPESTAPSSSMLLRPRAAHQALALCCSDSEALWQTQEKKWGNREAGGSSDFAPESPWPSKFAPEPD